MEESNEKLNKQLKEVKERLDYSSLEGMSSIGEVFQSFGSWPVYTFICTKILALMSGSDSIVRDFVIPLSRSTVFGLYSSFNVASLLLFLSIFSNVYYKQCETEIKGYEAIINYLEEEIKVRNQSISEENVFRQQMVKALIDVKKYLKDGVGKDMYEYYMKEFEVTDDEVKVLGKMKNR